MEATKFLKRDHRAVTELFDQYRKLGARAIPTRRTLYTMIHRMLDAHTRMEEEIFYPAVKTALRLDDSRQIITEALEEHRLATQLLEELSKMDIETETVEFDAKMTLLMDNVERHIDEEEKDMFKHARKCLADEDLDELGREMEIRRDEILGGEDDRRRPTADESAGYGGYGTPGV